MSRAAELGAAPMRGNRKEDPGGDGQERCWESRPRGPSVSRFGLVLPNAGTGLCSYAKCSSMRTGSFSTRALDSKEEDGWPRERKEGRKGVEGE